MATNYRDTSGDRGWTEGQGRQSGPPEGRRRPEGTHAAAPPRGAGRGPAPSPSGDRDLARPEEGDDPQAPRVAHRALADVHARQAEHEGGHGLGSCGRGRWHRREERSTPRELGGAPSIGEEPEVADAHEAARENVEKEAAKELGGRQRHRPPAVSPGVVLPPACREPSRTEAHLAGVHADQPVIGDRHAVGLPVGRQV